jgi:hypothetical protein
MHPALKRVCRPEPAAKSCGTRPGWRASLAVILCQLKEISDHMFGNLTMRSVVHILPLDDDRQLTATL